MPSELLRVKCINSMGVGFLTHGYEYLAQQFPNLDYFYINGFPVAKERFKVLNMTDGCDETKCDETSLKNGGIKHDQGKRDISLIPVDALLAVTEVFDFGKNKYGSHNWRAGFAWTRLSSAILRHTLAWIKGEDNDPESGLPHLAHAAASILMLLELTLKKVGTDDRFKYENN